MLIVDDGTIMRIDGRQIEVSVDVLKGSRDEPDKIIIKQEHLVPTPISASDLRRLIGRDVSFQPLSYAAKELASSGLPSPC